MQVKVKENRKVYCIDAIGTQNENNTIEMQIEVPEQYKDFNKKIVFITIDGIVWDIIENNTYKLTNTITKYRSVKFYIWLTKDEKDFRSEEKILTFNSNTNANSKLTKQELNGINKVLKILEDEIIRVDSIEKEIKILNEKVKAIQVEEYDDTEIRKAISDLNKNKANVEDVYNKKELNDKMNSGEFKGEDGFSPSANIVENENGATITITDKEGTTTVEILNGKDGDKGEPRYKW